MHALLGAVGADREEDRVEEQRDQVDLVEVAAPERSKRSRSSSQIRDAVDFEVFPSPASSHSDSTSRIDRPRTNAPITIAFSGSVRNNRLRAPREQLGHERLGRLTDLRDLDRSSPSAVCSRRGRNPLRIPDS